MAMPEIEPPDLPEYMTWEELELLPDEIANQIELWDGKVVWVRRGPSEHQTITRRLTNEIERCARATMATDSDQCWRVTFETNVFFGGNKSNFVTPDFMVYRCLERPYLDVRASDVLLAGEVHSPSNTQTDIEAKKARYASERIPYYWEVSLARPDAAVAMVRAFALTTDDHGHLPEGIKPLRPTNYLVIGEWTPPIQLDGIIIDHPFPIRIPWSELEI
ncbi:Uma2 family endonuclease [Nocardia sp. NPDC127579]|uniref:Uma2 family endonuclease n=1 Tax=Nocardia sp. NPDC127579 TaxID=3345402 RepID=UPI00363531FD